MWSQTASIIHGNCDLIFVKNYFAFEAVYMKTFYKARVIVFYIILMQIRSL